MELTKQISNVLFLCCWNCLMTNLLIIPICKGFSSVSPFPPSSFSSSSSTTYTSLATSTTSSSSVTQSDEFTSSTWKPKIASLKERKILRNRGMEQIETETIGSIGSIHHVEFWCGDARSMANQFAIALGMSLTGTTGQSTGNDQCVSYGLESGDRCRLLLTAPYSRVIATRGQTDNNNNSEEYDAPMTLPNFSVEAAHAFFQKHGLAARAIGIEVIDASKAFEVSVANGATPVLKPTFLPTCPAQIRARGNYDNSLSTASTGEDGCYISEVSLYGDVVLRYVSFITTNETNDDDDIISQPFLPHLAPVEDSKSRSSDDNDDCFGIYKIDHAVGNVHNLQEAQSRIKKLTGFHEFAEFTSEDVGTIDSGLNSVVLASDSEEVLLPINEPTNGRRKSQIQTYLEQNEGSGVQHLALKTKDIFSTVRKMRQNQRYVFGFELMKRPSDEYYKELPDRLGDQLTPTQYKDLEELGILADSDEEGILFQLFTKPVGDRPTFFFEIIQRIGCVVKYDNDDDSRDSFVDFEQPGCGGFGQGNFRELFKSIEEHEKTLKV